MSTGVAQDLEVDRIPLECQARVAIKEAQRPSALLEDPNVAVVDAERNPHETNSKRLGSYSCTTGFVAAAE